MLQSPITLTSSTYVGPVCVHVCVFQAYVCNNLNLHLIYVKHLPNCVFSAELHEPVLNVTQSNSPEETVVSCSVTGRPAPTVTLRVLKHNVHLSNYSSDSVSNTNGTVTVTTTAVLPGFHDNSTQVGCAVSVLSGPQIERFMMIPEVKQTSADGEKHFKKYRFID